MKPSDRATAEGIPFTDQPEGGKEAAAAMRSAGATLIGQDPEERAA